MAVNRKDPKVLLERNCILETWTVNELWEKLAKVEPSNLLSLEGMLRTAAAYELDPEGFGNTGCKDCPK